MMRLNLIPIKAARRVGSAKTELLAAVGVLAGIAAVLFLWNLTVQSTVTSAEEKVERVKAQLEELKQEEVRIEEFKKKASTLEKKIKVIDDLEKARIGPAQMLDDLATILTEQKKVWLTKATTDGATLNLEGGAMDNENVSEFQIALSRQSKFFKNVNLKVVEEEKSKKDSNLRWKISCEVNFTAG